jgi:hypothetical protein
MGRGVEMGQIAESKNREGCRNGSRLQKARIGRGVEMGQDC